MVEIMFKNEIGATTNLAYELVIDNICDLACKMEFMGCDLVNPETGELIEASELRKVLGILSGIQENKIWELNPVDGE